MNIKALFLMSCVLLSASALRGQTWYTLGTGADAPVLALKPFDGGLAVGGEFRMLNDNFHTNLGWYYPTGSGTYFWSHKMKQAFSLTAMGFDVPGTYISAIEDFDDFLHVGGLFFYPFYFDAVNIGYLKYNASFDEYDFSIYYDLPISSIYALQVFNDKLFIGGTFQGFWGTEYIAYANSGDYPSPRPYTPGDGLDGLVTCFAVYDGELYAGGSFSNSGSTAVSRIARWNGSTWDPVGGGLNGTAYAMQVYDGELVVGGTFSDAGGVAVENIAKWDGSSWSALGDGLYTSFLSTVRALAMHNGGLHAGGFFNQSGSVSLSNLAMWDGSSWSDVGEGTDGIVNTLASFDGRLYVGGDFTMVGSTSANNIAAYDDGGGFIGLTTPSVHALTLLTFPNPVADRIYMESPILDGNNAIVMLFDLQGKELALQRLSAADRLNGLYSVDMREYADGLYMVSVVSELGVATARIVKGR